MIVFPTNQIDADYKIYLNWKIYFKNLHTNIIKQQKIYFKY